MTQKTTLDTFDTDDPDYIRAGFFVACHRATVQCHPEFEFRGCIFNTEIAVEQVHEWLLSMTYH